MAVHRSGNRAVQNHERLQVAVELERMIAALAANAADAAAAERCRQVAHKERVDPHQPGAQGTAHPFGPLRDAGEHDCGQPIGGAVGELDRFGLVGKRLEGEHRAEDLALHDLTVVRRRFDQRWFVVQASLDRLTASDDRVTSRPRPFDKAMDDWLGDRGAPVGPIRCRRRELSPSTSASACAWNLVRNSSRIDSSTRSRVPARQT